MSLIESFYGCLEICFPCCCRPKMVYLTFDMDTDFDSDTSSGSDAGENDGLITIDPIEELSDSDI